MINRETATPATNIPVATRPAGFEQLGAILSAMNEQLAALSEADFAAETDCAGWRVRDVVAHLAASAEEMKWPWGFPVRTARGRRRYPELAPLDARNQIQIDDLAALDNEELLAFYRQRQPVALAGIQRMPAFLRRAKMPSGLPGVPKIRIAYLMDVICARDVWMHAIDIHQATGKVRVVSAHDEAVIDQIVRDLGVTWSGSTIELRLSGASNSWWILGAGQPTAQVTVDAVQFCRLLAGRPTDQLPELMAGEPAALTEITAARVLF
jgi:uncharacterized protein (TIGR03083 family)